MDAIFQSLAIGTKSMLNVTVFDGELKKPSRWAMTLVVGLLQTPEFSFVKTSPNLHASEIWKHL